MSTTSPEPEQEEASPFRWGRDSDSSFEDHSSASTSPPHAPTLVLGKGGKDGTEEDHDGRPVRLGDISPGGQSDTSSLGPAFSEAGDEDVEILEHYFEYVANQWGVVDSDVMLKQKENGGSACKSGALESSSLVTSGARRGAALTNEDEADHLHVDDYSKSMWQSYGAFAGNCQIEKCIVFLDEGDDILDVQRLSRRPRLASQHNSMAALGIKANGVLFRGKEHTKEFLESTIRHLNEAYVREPDCVHACLRAVGASVSLFPKHNMHGYIEAVQVLKSYQLVFELDCAWTATALREALHVVGSVSTECVLRFDFQHCGDSGQENSGDDVDIGVLGTVQEDDEEKDQADGRDDVDKALLEDKAEDKAERGRLSLMREIAKMRHAHVKLLPSGREQHMNLQFLRAFGPDRCIYASGWQPSSSSSCTGEIYCDDHDTPTSRGTNLLQEKRCTTTATTRMEKGVTAVIAAVVASYQSESDGLRDRPSSRESNWTLGYGANWSFEEEAKHELRVRLTLENIFRRNAERKYII
ncbi:unnamed protein product [Amoebophrya sp. A25]|nr:unnamed protein product [Amoebophrya sp. A25]|eukprot:GSA25T00009516001.1